MFVVITLGTVVLWFLMPVSAINRHALNRVKPGMTVNEAEKAIGLECGWYDGIGSARPNAPDRGKGYMPHWLGLNGEMVLIVDHGDRVIRTEYYRARIGSWHLSDYLWERFTWLQVTETPMLQRMGWYLTLALAGTLALGELFVAGNSPNVAAWYGLIGLILGPVLSIAVFSEGLSASRNGDMLTEAVLGPFVAATIGIILGWTRGHFKYVRSDFGQRPHVHSSTADTANCSAGKN